MPTADLATHSVACKQSLRHAALVQISMQAQLSGWGAGAEAGSNCSHAAAAAARHAHITAPAPGPRIWLCLGWTAGSLQRCGSPQQGPVLPQAALAGRQQARGRGRGWARVPGLGQAKRAARGRRQEGLSQWGLIQSHLRLECLPRVGLCPHSLCSVRQK